MLAVLAALLVPEDDVPIDDAVDLAPLLLLPLEDPTEILVDGVELESRPWLLEDEEPWLLPIPLLESPYRLVDCDEALIF